MKYMSPDVSGFKKPPNRCDTFEFDDTDRPPPSHRYFAPSQDVINGLKNATVFARVTLAEQMDERVLSSLLYDGPTPLPFENLIVYAGRMLLIFSNNPSEHTMQYSAVMRWTTDRNLVLEDRKCVMRIPRSELEDVGIELDVYEDRIVELCDDLP